MWPQGPQRATRRLLEIVPQLGTRTVLQHLDHQREQLLPQTNIIIHHLEEETVKPISTLVTLPPNCSYINKITKRVIINSHLCNAGNEGIEAGGGAHLLRCNHEAALLLVIAKQHVQVALHGVESLSTADVSLCAALVFGHKFHEHHNQLVNRLVIYASILREQVSDDGVVLGRRGLAYKRS